VRYQHRHVLFAMTASGTARRYKAFISYSHAADGQLAPALQRGLQQFARPWYKPVAFRIFRDQTGFGLTEDLWRDIVEALTDSEYLIVMASPAAAGSPWVAREMEQWLDVLARPARSVLIVLSEGPTPIWNQASSSFGDASAGALPARLITAFGAEPKYVDFRWARDPQTDLSLANNHFREDIADLLVPLLNRRKEAIIGEEVRQRRITRGLVTTVVVALAALSAALGMFWLTARSRLVVATARGLAAQSEHLASRLDGLPKSVQLALASMAYDPSPEAEVTLRRGLEMLPRPGPSLAEPSGGIGAVAFSLDGSRVAAFGPGGGPSSVGGQVVQGPVDVGAVNVSDAATGAPITTFALATGASTASAVFDAESRRIVVFGNDHIGRVLEAATGRELARVPASLHAGDAFALSAGGEYWAVVRRNGNARLWSVRDQRIIARTQLSCARGANAPTAFAVSRSGGYVVVFPSLMEGGRVHACIWDVAGGNERPLETTDFVRRAVFTSGDAHLVLTDSRRIRVLAVTTGSEIVARDTQEAILLLAVDDDGRFAATAAGFNSPVVRIWNLGTGEEVARIVHDGDVFAVAFAPDGRHIATAGFASDEGSSGSARVWDLAAAGAYVRARMSHRDSADTVTFTGEGCGLIAGDGPSIRRWSCDTGTESQPSLSLGGGSSETTALAVLANPPRIAAIDLNGTLQVWPLDAPNAPVRVGDRGTQGHPAAFTLDVHYAAAVWSNGGDRVVRLFDVERATELPPIPVAAEEDDANALAIDGGGGHVALALPGPSDSEKSVVQVRGVADGTTVSFEPGKSVFALAFRPGHDEVVMSGEGEAIVWNWRLRRERLRMPNASLIEAVTVTPDGKYVATLGRDGVVVVRVLDDGSLAATIVAAPNPADWKWGWAHLTFDPRGEYLAATIGKGAPWVWRWRVPDVTAEACRRITTNLSDNDWRTYVGWGSRLVTCPGLDQRAGASPQPTPSTPR
jgi:WD40 repeat protein